jgi:hypothetical protein
MRPRITVINGSRCIARGYIRTMVPLAYLDSEQPALAASPTRGAVLLMIAADAGTFVLATGAAVVAATAWILARTDAGAVDVSSYDAAFALSLAAAMFPAWTAWQWGILVGNGMTFGNTRRSSRADTETRGRRRACWLALHPVTAPAWAWLLGMLALLVPPITDAALWVLAALAGLSISSLVLVLLRPGTRPLHVRIAMLRADQGG